MENRLLSSPQADASLAANDLLKATSLLYLKDALEGQRYEECAALIQSAKDYGADLSEVSNVIAQYLRKFNSGQNEAVFQKARKFFLS